MFRLASTHRPKHEGVVSVRLFIGNLPYSATEPDLREHLSSVGAPAQIVLPTDRETGRPRGFAFVDYADREVAEEAIRRFNQQPFKGRPLAVSEARPREDRPPAPARGPAASAVHVRGGHLRASAVPGPAAFRRDPQKAVAARRDRAAGTSAPMRRRRTSASLRAKTTAGRRVRSRSARSVVSTTTTKTGAPRTTPKRSNSTISRPARRRTNWRKTKPRWTPTSGSSAS